MSQAQVRMPVHDLMIKMFTSRLLFVIKSKINMHIYVTKSCSISIIPTMTKALIRCLIISHN